MTVGLALIVKNEAGNLPDLLTSIEGAFDQIVLVDTGSTDGTVEVFSDWADAKREKVKVASFDWINDFAAARNFADEQLDTDWLVWADADDVIHGALNIRPMVEKAPENVVGFICDYDYAQHPDTGSCVCMLRRERIVKRGHGRWIGRVHEAQNLEGGAVVMVPGNQLTWKHNKQAQGPDVSWESNDRNLKILEAWYDDEPENPRVLAYLGTENAVRGNHRGAIDYYRSYIKLAPQWNEERAQVHRKLSASLEACNEWDEAKMCAHGAIDVMPTWPDSYLTLAECHLHDEEFAKAEYWARYVIAIGPPQTMLIVNPLDYSYHVRSILSRALGAQGKIAEAREVAEQALQIFPDTSLAQFHQDWSFDVKRDQTADTFVMCAQTLVAHDEQAKALTLLTECVPHYAVDHPKVVQARAGLRTRLRWLLDNEYADHYENGGSKPEDFIGDDRRDELCEALPRCAFLLAGVREQQA